MEKGQDPLFYPSCLLFLESVFCICFFACKNRKGKGEQSLFHGLTTPDLAVLNILTSCVISDSNSDDNEQQKDGEEEDDCRG